MSDAPKAPEVPVLLSDPLAPDIFADEATGFYLLGGNVRVTFSTWRVDHEQSPSAAHRVVIGRLVMPVGQAQAMVKGLADFLQHISDSPSEPTKPANERK